MVAAAAKVSTAGSEAEKLADPENQGQVRGLINYLMKHRHGTPFEHASMTFFVHAPIFVWREWHRHRIGFSYNEESGRYKKLDPVFWIPRRDRRSIPVAEYKPSRPNFEPMTDEQYTLFVDNAHDAYAISYAAYQRLLSAGLSNESARCVLPVGIYSSCWVTCNPRSLMHFLSLRVHNLDATFVSYPQAEIEEAAVVCEETLQRGWPLVHEAFVKNGRVAP